MKTPNYRKEVNRIILCVGLNRRYAARICGSKKVYLHQEERKMQISDVIADMLTRIRNASNVKHATVDIPASNMKLVTTGVALHRLGSGFTFRTRLGYSGSIIDRVLKGDLYIMGGGDPTLASDDSIAVELPALFREWTTILKKAGIERIDGHIIGDDRYFDLPMPEEQTWQWDDCGTYYGAGTSALTFFENIQSFEVSPGPETGYPATVSEKYPV